MQGRAQALVLCACKLHGSYHGNRGCVLKAACKFRHMMDSTQCTTMPPNSIADILPPVTQHCTADAANLLKNTIGPTIGRL